MSIMSNPLLDTACFPDMRERSLQTNHVLLQFSNILRDRPVIAAGTVGASFQSLSHL
jgi:hypothetical protein